ncbi:DNA polymerase III subunit beta [Sphingobacterium sp.]|uniref:DNA polymerase III subunit beta n=1 Tax=Sphingobacterium sp. TaxID=341027 RepID=UPI0028A9BAEF|nr:DNA polymerase III subunit beta [Sphingobacterium sp.]
MKFKAKTKSLIDILSISNTIVETSAVIPIIRNIVLSLTGNKLRFTSSDMMNTLVSEIEVTGESDGTSCIDGKLLLNILKNLSEESVMIDSKEVEVETLVGNVKQKSIQLSIVLTTTSGKYDIPGLNPKDFPKVPIVENSTKLEISGEAFRDAIAKVSFAVVAEMGDILNNIYLDIQEGSLTVAGVNNAVFSEVEHKIVSEKAKTLLVNKKSLLLSKTLFSKGDVEINYNANFVVFSNENIQLFARLADGIFPNYKAVFPKSSQNILLINNTQLGQAIKRLLVMANGALNLFALDFQESQLVISTSDKDFGKSAIEQLPIQYSGEPLRIGINGKYLLEVLNTMSSENVNLSVISPNKPIVIWPDDESSQRALIGPMSLVGMD